LPSGDYLLIAGVHDAASGERLKTPDGQDHVILDRLTIR
jgi:hypothetical protein